MPSAKQRDSRKLVRGLLARVIGVAACGIGGRILLHQAVVQRRAPLTGEWLGLVAIIAIAATLFVLATPDGAGARLRSDFVFDALAVAVLLAGFAVLASSRGWRDAYQSGGTAAIAVSILALTHLAINNWPTGRKNRRVWFERSTRAQG